ncbi:hypothetical protein HNP55_002864 [Paucibacter oligotrophus]|nr:MULTISPECIES: hypothetical protein [Betaproteobacteria]MBB4844328.1 hypothetical protein [Roseateles oligotrophus]
MINRYRSPYPNYIHQLFITPSKHLYALKDRRLKWQDKAMEVKLDKIEGADKEHVVHYIVADHTSAAFYAEMRTNKTLMTPIEFLMRAWKKKSDFFFHGVPEHVIVPTAVSSKYPEVRGWLEQLGVGLIPPSSGFQAGIHQVRTWENDVANSISLHSYLEKTPCTLDNISVNLAKALRMANDGEINRPGVRMSRKQLWGMQVENRPPIRYME